MAIDKKLQIFDDDGNPVDYDILASDVKFNDGKDLPTKLDEMEDEIGEGGYTPPQGGIPKTDLAPSVQQTLDDVANKVDKVLGKGLSTNDYTTEDKTKLANLPTNPVQSISVNGQTPQTPTNGNVNIEVSGIKGDKGDKGDTGDVQVDGNGNVLIYNGLDKTTTGAALDASQGQFIGKLLNANDNTFYNVWVGTQQQLEALNGDYDDNTIYLVGTVPGAVTRYSINKSGIGQHITVGGANANDTSVREGNSFSLILSPADGYTIDSCYATMGNDTIQGVPMTGNDLGKYSITINNVTGAITIQAAATKHITEIEVSAGTRNGNTIQLSATVKPTDADNVTLAWSISEDGTNYSNSTTHFSINSNGELTINEGTNNASVTVKCADTNEGSDTAQGTLTLTGLSYESTPVPITGITDITATRTAANTLTLEATADGNTGIEFSIVGTSPKSKKLDYTNSPATLEEVDSVELSGDTLSYKEDCKVTIQASAENGTVTFQKEITITHDSGDAIWFEDEVTLAALNSNGVGSGGKVTYSQAAAVTVLKFLASNTTIRRFKEFMWFTGITQMGPNKGDRATFKNCSNLECIGIPPVSLAINAGSSAVNHPFYGCALKEVHIVSFADYKLSMWTDSGTMASAGRSSEGMGLFINGQEVLNVVIPEGVGISTRYAGFRFTSFTAEYITSFPVGALYRCSELISLKIGNGVTELGERAISNDVNGVQLAKLQDVDLGSGITALSSQCFRGCTSLSSLTLRYDGDVVSQNNSFYINGGASRLPSVDVYVPQDLISAYQSTSPWSGANSINAITE